MTTETLNPTAANTWRCDVDTASSAETPVWAQIRAMSQFQPAVNPTTQDSSDYDSEGWGSDATTLRKWQNVATVMRKIDGTGAYDPAQEFLRAAADSLEPVHLRWYERHSNQGEAYEGWALVQWAPQGGNTTALNVVQVTMLGQGARVAITHPNGA